MTDSPAATRHAPRCANLAASDRACPPPGDLLRAQVRGRRHQGPKPPHTTRNSFVLYQTDSRARRGVNANGGVGDKITPNIAVCTAADLAGLDEGLLALPVPVIVYMENPFMDKTLQRRMTVRPRLYVGRHRRAGELPRRVLQRRGRCASGEKYLITQPLIQLLIQLSI